MKQYYVYEWYILDTNEVFYVGKGKDNRVSSLRGRNKFFNDMHSSHECGYRIVKNNLSEKEAFDFEIYLIKHYRDNFPNYRLTNQTDGGEGISGYKMSDKERLHLSRINKGVGNPNYNNKWSDEQKRNLSLKMKYRYLDKNNPNYNNKWNDEQRKHLSRIRKDKKYNGENHGMAKRVICLETLEIFSCIKYAREKYNTAYMIDSYSKIVANSYHLKEIDDDYVIDAKALKSELIEYLLKQKRYTIFICLETLELIIGLEKFSKKINKGTKYINNRIKKQKKIEIDGFSYIDIETYSRLIQ